MQGLSCVNYDYFLVDFKNDVTWTSSRTVPELNLVVNSSLDGMGSGCYKWQPFLSS